MYKAAVWYYRAGKLRFVTEAFAEEPCAHAWIEERRILLARVGITVDQISVEWVGH